MHAADPPHANCNAVVLQRSGCKDIRVDILHDCFDLGKQFLAKEKAFMAASPCMQPIAAKVLYESCLHQEDIGSSADSPLAQNRKSLGSSGIWRFK